MENAVAMDWGNLIKWITILSVSAVLWSVWFWALLDCLKNEPTAGNERIAWTLIVFFGQILGALAYIVLRRPRRISIYGQ